MTQIIILKFINIIFNKNNYKKLHVMNKYLLLLKISLVF